MLWLFTAQFPAGSLQGPCVLKHFLFPPSPKPHCCNFQAVIPWKFLDAHMFPALSHQHTQQRIAAIWIWVYETQLLHSLTSTRASPIRAGSTKSAARGSAGLGAARNKGKKKKLWGDSNSKVIPFSLSLLQGVWRGPGWGLVSHRAQGHGGGTSRGLEGQQDRQNTCEWWLGLDFLLFPKPSSQRRNVHDVRVGVSEVQAPLRPQLGMGTGGCPLPWRAVTCPKLRIWLERAPDLPKAQVLIIICVSDLPKAQWFVYILCSFI